MRNTFFIFLIISALTTTHTSAAVEQTAILLGQDYLQTTYRAIDEAKESIYIAMYFINVEPAPTNNPASILLEALIAAHARGVRVKVILDDTKFSISYNAYKRLRQAGIGVYLDSPQAVLHGKAIVVDSKICILGSHNWSRASLINNTEFAARITDPGLAKTLLEHFNHIQLAPPEIPAAQPQSEGIKVPLISELFTNHSEKAFDLYLYLLNKAQTQHTDTLKIDHKEIGQALGYTNNYFFNVFQPLRKLTKKYHLIDRRPWSKYLILKRLSPQTANSKETKGAIPEVVVPYAYWSYGLDKTLDFHAKYLYLICLAEAQNSQRNPYWFRSNQGLSEIYQISEHSITKGMSELEAENILEVYRHRPEESGDFEDRPANNYRLNPLQSDFQFRQALQSLSDKYGADITQKARELSTQLNEPKDIQKIETYIGLINTYGYERVKEANSESASKRRETGFHDISQVILKLQKGTASELASPIPHF